MRSEPLEHFRRQVSLCGQLAWTDDAPVRCARITLSRDAVPAGRRARASGILNAADAAYASIVFTTSTAWGGFHFVDVPPGAWRLCVDAWRHGPHGEIEGPFRAERKVNVKAAASDIAQPTVPLVVDIALAPVAQAATATPDKG
ncbi:hypothetical protein [Pseudorhodoferax sp.]|uniref:hypothetical protein n=1 Tax=Pseudorhodoferax sp. TaxID=1993553 RepID=UPI002DD696AB|nr:hypothetical protein [Pseudorhodoferax sp.]